MGKHEPGFFIDNAVDVPNDRRIERLQFPAFLVLRPGFVRFRKRRTDPVGRSTTGFDPNRAHRSRITLDDPDEGHEKRPLIFRLRLEIQRLGRAFQRPAIEEHGLGFGFLRGNLAKLRTADQFVSQTRFRSGCRWHRLVLRRVRRYIRAMAIIAHAAV